MSNKENLSAAPELVAAFSDFIVEGPDLLRRLDGHKAFWDARLGAGLDFTGRITLGRVQPEGQVITRARERASGVNFASRDPLSLSSHPVVCDAAMAAIRDWGTHGAGPVGAQGGSLPLLKLEEQLADTFFCKETTVFPSGWAAGYGVVRALVRDCDHVIVDTLAHASFQEAAAAATRKVHRVPHGSSSAIEQRLARVRASDAQCGILVITESLFALDSSRPDLRHLQETCNAYGATLVISVTNELGAAGSCGLGSVGEQNLIGMTDIIVGSLSNALVSNGGFVASNTPGLGRALSALASTLSSSAAVSPVQASVALAALSITRSAEGGERRRRLATNVSRLRKGLAGRAFEVLGESSPVVSTVLGSVAEGRLMTRTMLTNGALVNLVEHPAVGRSGSRWVLRPMADHTAAQIDRLVALSVEARELVYR